MVQRDYAGLLEGVSYVEPMVWDGSVDDISGAVAHVRKLGLEPACCQVASNDAEALREHVYKGKHAITDSFVKEVYDRLGMLREFRKNLPLVFDLRNAEREAALLERVKLPKRKRLIGVALGGVTSPFPYKPLLMELLRGRFRQGYAIVDLDDIRAERLFDMLAVLEKLDVLVAADSALLHLAWALYELPVCALTQDTPSLWHGSAWRPQHVWYCRYKDFPHRAAGLLNAIPHATRRDGFYTGRRIVHVYNAYDSANPPPRLWGVGPWNDLPITLGMFGRDSHYSPLKDEKRYPFLKDAVRAAYMAANDNDVIVLTRHDVCFEECVTTKLLDRSPCYAMRVVRGKDGDTWSAHADLFAFNKAFWDRVATHIPEMVLGRDPYWPRVMLEVMRSHGAAEIHSAVYRVEE